jgi:hypothetical protein
MYKHNFYTVLRNKQNGIKSETRALGKTLEQTRHIHEIKNKMVYATIMFGG